LNSKFAVSGADLAEVSAKTGDRIFDLFVRLANACIARIENWMANELMGKAKVTVEGQNESKACCSKDNGIGNEGKKDVSNSRTWRSAVSQRMMSQIREHGDRR
jgi:hypothetical protein